RWVAVALLSDDGDPELPTIKTAYSWRGDTPLATAVGRIWADAERLLGNGQNAGADEIDRPACALAAPWRWCYPAVTCIFGIPSPAPLAGLSLGAHHGPSSRPWMRSIASLGRYRLPRSRIIARSRP